MINLFINWFVHPDPERRKELEFCLEKNEENTLIDNIFKLTSGPKWPTYNDYFRLMGHYPNDINILSNLDIYFDETLNHVHKIREHQCFALTRWELVDDAVIPFEVRNPGHPARFSQDVWIFRGAPKVRNATFSMGWPGCDNRIAKLIHDSGYEVLNPSKTIRAIHVHRDPSRNTARDVNRVGGPYLWINPTVI